MGIVFLLFAPPPLVLICVVMYMCTMYNNYYNFCIHIRVCMCVYHNVNFNGYLCSVCVYVYLWLTMSMIKTCCWYDLWPYDSVSFDLWTINMIVPMWAWSQRQAGQAGCSCMMLHVHVVTDGVYTLWAWISCLAKWNTLLKEKSTAWTDNWLYMSGWPLRWGW